MCLPGAAGRQQQQQQRLAPACPAAVVLHCCRLRCLRPARARCPLCGPQPPPRTCTLPAPARRILHSHPNQWQVHVFDRQGGSQCLRTQATEPTYAEVEALLRDRPDSMMNKSIFDRLRDEFRFNQETMKGGP